MSADQSSRARFFRQSGWMIFATFAGGLCMFAVHSFAPFMGDKEYGLFGTLLAMLNVTAIPSIGLQTVLAHQAASAITPADKARLTGTVRGLLWWTFVLWLVVAAATVVFHRHIIEMLTITNPWALWLVLVFALGQLWSPIVFGTLQGIQNFLWLGWGMISNGLGRLVAVAVIVTFFGGKATGAIGGALIGISMALVICFAQSRQVWGAREHSRPDWRNWLAQVVPLTIGLGVTQFLFSVDMIIVRSIYGEDQTGFYSASGMIGRGLVMFAMPLSLVMFPKIVHSKATGKKSNVLLYTLASTAILAVLGATGVTLGAMALKQIAADPTFGAGWLPAGLLAKLQKHPDALVALGRMLPWFVWAMLPLALGNVLLNNLLAHKMFRSIPYLVVTVAAYVATAVVFADVESTPKGGVAFVRIIQILGIFNLLYMSVCGWFSWRGRSEPGPSKAISGDQAPANTGNRSGS